MVKLTEFQKNFILDYFFATTDAVGWRNIGEKLLETGKCIVAGENRLYCGGIGNFIKTSPAEDAVGCTLYEFNREEFLNSAVYQDVKQLYIESRLPSLEQTKKEVEEELENLKTL